MDNEFSAKFDAWVDRVGQAKAIGLAFVLPSLFLFLAFLVLPHEANGKVDPFPGSTLIGIFALLIARLVTGLPRATINLISFGRQVAKNRRFRGHEAPWQLEVRCSVGNIVLSALRFHFLAAALLTIVTLVLAKFVSLIFPITISLSWWLTVFVRLSIASIAIDLLQGSLLEIAGIRKHLGRS